VLSLNINLQFVMLQGSLKVDLMITFYLVTLTKTLINFGSCGKKSKLNLVALIFLILVVNVIIKVLLMNSLVISIFLLVIKVLVVIRTLLMSILTSLLSGYLIPMMLIALLNVVKQLALMESLPSIYLMQKLFYLIMQHGYVPKTFGNTNGVVVPILKHRLGDASSLDNYRAITLLVPLSSRCLSYVC